MNKIIFADCLNEINGLPTLKDKSFDLCLTDPPFNVKYKGLTVGGKTIKHSNDIQYEDYKEDYFEWCIKWFRELERVCNGIVFTPGIVNLYDWIQYKKPSYNLKCAHYDNGSMFHLEPLLFYGKIPRYNYLRDVLKIPPVKYQGFKHPSPKSLKLFMKILEAFRPKNVIDPFMGSGTTAEAAKTLGIPYFGYEINKEYESDINIRLKKPIQKTLI